MLHQELAKLDLPIAEVIWVDDHSIDDSLDILKELCNNSTTNHYISLSRNFGQQVALQAGIDYCTGSYVVLMDADGQDPPNLITLLYEKIVEGYDVVYASRSQRPGETWLKKTSAKWFYRIFNKWAPFQMPLDAGDFRIFSKRVADVLRRMPEQHKFLRGQVAWMGFRQTSISYERPQRVAGETKYSSQKMWRLAIDAITSYTDFPLKLITWLGILVSAFSVIMMVYALISRFILHDFVQGWTSLMIAVMFVGGVQMIAIGIIGIYLHRMYQNQLNRPLYLIKENSLKKSN